jgi:hypothetical protein
MSLEVHIAGIRVMVGSRVRQRCAWCGAVLDDVDLDLVAVPVDQPDCGVPEWRVGSLVAIDGGMAWSVLHRVTDAVPEGLLCPARPVDHGVAALTSMCRPWVSRVCYVVVPVVEPSCPSGPAALSLAGRS